MQTLNEIRKQIKNIQGLKSIVRTMKVLASVSIRQYERATLALADYHRTTELGLQVILKEYVDVRSRSGKGARKKIGAIVLGSDQGMCGQFNEQISSFSLETLRRMGYPADQCQVLSVGSHPATRLAAAGQPMADILHTPTVASAIRFTVQEIIQRVEQWRSDGIVDEIYLFHNRLVSPSVFRPQISLYWPINLEQFKDLKQRPWPTNQLPLHTMDSDLLLLNLICQHLFVVLSLAMAESLAAENTSRLIAMQVAERNINDRLVELTGYYHQQRQINITSELLDVVSGAEILAAQQISLGKVKLKPPHKNGAKPENSDGEDPVLAQQLLAKTIP
ncbi:MAG: F0F1 ATP synthase subunit gamma [Anaerolineaceae bacterium]|jgi:F-type H+-transporting ATPase subunit gamma